MCTREREKEQFVIVSLGNLLEKRSGEVVEMCADLNALVGIVRDQAQSVRDTHDKHSSTAQDQLETIHTYAESIEVRIKLLVQN